MKTTFITCLLIGCFTASIATAAPTVVVIEVDKPRQSPEQLEKAVLNPIEQRLTKLPRITVLNGQANEGKLRVEAHFDNGATRQDLLAVTEQIEALKKQGVVLLESYSAQLAAPSIIP